MKYTVTPLVANNHDLSRCILFCLAENTNKAHIRFMQLFGTMYSEVRYVKIEEGWNFNHPSSKELFTQKIVEDFNKNYSPEGVYTELFGKYYIDYSAYPHYSFEYMEVSQENTNKTKNLFCTENDPAVERTKEDGRAWPYIKSWNTRYSHPDSKISILDAKHEQHDCPNCKAGWIYERVNA